MFQNAMSLLLFNQQIDYLKKMTKRHWTWNYPNKTHHYKVLSMQAPKPLEPTTFTNEATTIIIKCLVAGQVFTAEAI